MTFKRWKYSRELIKELESPMNRNKGIFLSLFKVAKRI